MRQKPAKLLLYSSAVLMPLCALLWSWPFFALAVDAMAKYHSRRAGCCSWAQSLWSAWSANRQYEKRERIRKTSRVVRREDEFSLIATPQAAFWVPSRAREELYYNLAEQERDIYRPVRSGDIVLDCGASIGVYARQALRQGARLVVAIEPSPENLECLKRNLAREIAERRVLVYPMGVWDKDDVLAMNVVPEDPGSNSFVRKPEKTARQILLPLTTIDKLVAELNLPRIDYIKMDIEGAERRALAGGAQTIKKFRPRMAICVYHLPDDPQIVPSVVRSIEPEYDADLDCLDTLDGVIPEVIHFQVD